MNEWRPHPKQEKALVSIAYEVLYGGARGGGKTAAGIAWLLYPIQNPKYRALVVRKNYVDLMDWYDRAQEIYCRPPFNAVARGRDEFEFPSGAKIKLGHLQDGKSYTKYQGHEYQRILIEELTQIPTEELYLKLIASCRSTIDIKPQIFCTANPGEIGSAWVKRRFVSPARAMTVFTDPVSGRTRVYIPATVDDNPTLQENDPDYVKFLDSLPPDLKAWWRYGSWEEAKVKGAIYSDELDLAVAQDRIGQVNPLPNVPVFIAFDLGLGDQQVCWFFQVVGDSIRFIDLFSENNKSWQYYAEMLIESGYNIKTVFLPHDGTKRSADTLRSFRDVLVSNGFKVVVNSRTSDTWADIQAVRANFWRFRFDADRCYTGIEALKNYRRKWIEDRQIYLDEALHDINSHYADALREATMAVLKHKIEFEKKINDPIMKQSIDNYDSTVHIKDTYEDLHSAYLTRTGGKQEY